MKPFAEWTSNEDAVDLCLAREMAKARWPDRTVTVRSLDFGYRMIVSFTGEKGGGLRVSVPLPQMTTKPPNFPAGWEPPPDWSRDAIQRALEVIDA